MIKLCRCRCAIFIVHSISSYRTIPILMRNSCTYYYDTGHDSYIFTDVKRTETNSKWNWVESVFAHLWIVSNQAPNEWNENTWWNFRALFFVWRMLFFPHNWLVNWNGQRMLIETFSKGRNGWGWNYQEFPFWTSKRSMHSINCG